MRQSKTTRTTEKDAFLAFLVFPHQLFETLPDAVIRSGATVVYMLEDPLLFFDPDARPFRYHRAKLVYMRACMKAYHDRVLAPRVQPRGIGKRTYEKGLTSTSGKRTPAWSFFEDDWSSCTGPGTRGRR